MRWRDAFELLRLCNTPATIYSPFPFFAISIFLISREELFFYDLPIMFSGILVSFLLTFPSNLWNHCNDIKEDLAQGKKTILTQNVKMQKTATYLSVVFYTCSILFSVYLSNEYKRPVYLFSLIWIFTTWWYSDNLILKKITGFRLKEHYSGELIAYSVAMPMHTLSVWITYSEMNSRGIIIVLAFFFLNISALLLKDLKDISGDKKSGLRTFGVVFLPSQLIRYSCYIMIGYYLVLLNPVALDVFGKGILLMALPFLYFLNNTFIPMYRKNWTVDAGDIKALKSIGYSIYGSIIFLGLGAFF